MNRVLGFLAAVVAGGLLAMAYAVGLSRSTSPPEPVAMQVDLDGYCRHLYGHDSAAIESPVPSRLSCSHVVNGVWGLDSVDLDGACRWQRGPRSHFEIREVGLGAHRPVAEVRCTR